MFSCSLAALLHFMLAMFYETQHKRYFCCFQISIAYLSYIYLLANMLADVENALGFVLQKSGPSIDKFLEIVFEFLKTRTDFYVISDDPSKGGLGFKKGVAEKLVLRSFRMFDQIEFDSSKFEIGTAKNEKLYLFAKCNSACVKENLENRIFFADTT